jgi:putative transposase
LPWKEISPVQQRQQLVDGYLEEDESMAQLCRKAGVSRKTGYKWVGRFLECSDVQDRSRRPHHSPSAVRPAVEEAIVEARLHRPRWGAKKLKVVLERKNPQFRFPSVSTFSRILKRNGLITPKRRRHKVAPATAPLGHATAPNALWCMDFKGDFMTGRTRCYPLTVMDAFSRYLIACVGLRRTRADDVRRVMERVFDTFGLPAAIRTDNGSPFASAQAPLGLSELSAWWRTLGVDHERIEPGKPQQNGRHERMHLTLKLDTAMPPCSSLRAQQRAFDRFRREYNEVRPHEALDNHVPLDFYSRSTRILPDPPYGRDFEYPVEFETVRVRKTGAITWNDRSIAVSEALRYRLLGLDWQPERGVWSVYFGSLLLGDLQRTRSQYRFVRRVPDAREAWREGCSGASTDQQRRPMTRRQMLREVPPSPTS